MVVCVYWPDRKTTVSYGPRETAYGLYENKKNVRRYTFSNNNEIPKNRFFTRSVSGVRFWRRNQITVAPTNRMDAANNDENYFWRFSNYRDVVKYYRLKTALRSCLKYDSVEFSGVKFFAKKTWPIFFYISKHVCIDKKLISK